MQTSATFKSPEEACWQHPSQIKKQAGNWLQRDSRLLVTSCDLHTNLKPIWSNQGQSRLIKINKDTLCPIRSSYGNFRSIRVNLNQSGILGLTRPINAIKGNLCLTEIIRYNWGQCGRFKVNLLGQPCLQFLPQLGPP